MKIVRHFRLVLERMPWGVIARLPGLELEGKGRNRPEAIQAVQQKAHEQIYRDTNNGFPLPPSDAYLGEPFVTVVFDLEKSVEQKEILL